MSVTLMVLMAVVFIEAVFEWYELAKVKEPVRDRYGDAVLADAPE